MALKIASTSSIGCSFSPRRPACMLPARQAPATPSSSRSISWHRASTRTAFAATDFVVADDRLMNCDEKTKGFCAEAFVSGQDFDDSEAMSIPTDLPRGEVQAFFSDEDMRKGSTGPGPEGEREGGTGGGGGSGPGQGEQEPLQEITFTESPTFTEGLSGSGPGGEQPQEVTFTEQDMGQAPPDLPGAPASTERATETGSPGESEQAGESKAVPAGGEESAGGGRFDEEATTPDKPYSPAPKDRGHGVPPHKDGSNTGPGPASGAEGEGHPSGEEEIPAAAI